MTGISAQRMFTVRLGCVTKTVGGVHLCIVVFLRWRFVALLSGITAQRVDDDGACLTAAAATSVGVCILLTTVSGQQLTIAPQGTQIKTFDSGIIFTCFYDNDRQSDEDDRAPWSRGNSPEMRWVGPDLNYISSTRGRSVLFCDISMPRQ